MSVDDWIEIARPKLIDACDSCVHPESNADWIILMVSRAGLKLVSTEDGKTS